MDSWWLLAAGCWALQLLAMILQRRSVGHTRCHSTAVPAKALVHTDFSLCLGIWRSSWAYSCVCLCTCIRYEHAMLHSIEALLLLTSMRDHWPIRKSDIAHTDV
jgi:hypothetical protein